MKVLRGKLTKPDRKGILKITEEFYKELYMYIKEANVPDWNNVGSEDVPEQQ